MCHSLRNIEHHHFKFEGSPPRREMSTFISLAPTASVSATTSACKMGTSCKSPLKVTAGLCETLCGSTNRKRLLSTSLLWDE